VGVVVETDGELRRAFWAKVSGRVDTVVVISVGGVGVVVARGDEGAEKGFAPVTDGTVNGFAGAFAAEGMEKGFANGLAAVEDALGAVTPKSDSPMLACGFFSSFCDAVASCALGTLFPSCPLVTLVALIPLILPSFLRQVFRLQLKI
jgi:hypothetical protein